MQEYIFLIVIASTIFLYRIISKNDLIGEVKFKISTHGIDIDDTFYYWSELSQFFFSNSYGSTELLVVDRKAGLPSRIMIFFREEDREHIIKSMNKYIRYIKEEPSSGLNKIYNSIIDKFDFEKKKE